jgi:hypothetical protein
MSPDVIRWLIALGVLAHGIGHVLFMPLLSGTMKLDASGHSWLLSGVIGDGLTQAVATIAGGALVVVFAIVSGGIVWQSTWWRAIAIVASLASMVLVIAMWDGLPTGPAAGALLFDAAVLVALVVVRWPAADLVGG